MKAEVVKIKIKMGDIEVEMTVEEAKELQRVLNETFRQPPAIRSAVVAMDNNHVRRSFSEGV